jgi:hypothetical protein
MTGPPDKRFLIAVLVFGIVGTGAGFNWLSVGRIVIRQGSTRVGVGPLPRPNPQEKGWVAGVIEGDDLLYYPLCLAWVALGVSMVTLTALGYFSANELFLKLAAYSCVGVLLLGFGTVAAALWSGP